MNDTVFFRTYGGDDSLDKSLIDIAKRHGQFAEIKIMTDERVPAFIERGRYLIFGGDEKKVAKLESAYSSTVLLPNLLLEQNGSIDVFPKATVVKITSSFCEMIRILEKIIDNEFMIYLFEKYGLPLPTVVTRRDFQILHRVYKRSVEEEGNEAETELKKLLEIVAGGKTIEEYEKEQGKKEGWFGKLFLKKEIKYTPISKNCVCKEHIIDLPYSKSKMEVLHGENGATIRRIDEELGKYPDIKWSLKEIATIATGGVNDNQYCHRLTYPTKHEATVASVVNKITFDLESRIYIKGAKNNVFATAIPSEVFREFAMAAAEAGLEYYFDETSAYIRQKPDEIGICVEGEVQLIFIGRIEGAIMRRLSNASHINKSIDS